MAGMLTFLLRVSPYFLGGMSIGEAWKDFMGSMTKEQSFELLDAFFKAGGNAIDTANIYRECLVRSRVLAVHATLFF